MKNAARLGRAMGPIVALWLVVPILLLRAAPAAPWLLAAAAGGVGLAAQFGCRLLSNRGWFAGAHPPLRLVGAALAVAGAVATALTGAIVVGHVATGDDRPIDQLLLAAAWATATIALAGAFAARVEFRGWLLHHADVRERTRPFAGAPIGPDRGALFGLLDDLADEKGAPGGAGALPALVRRVHLASDERYRRPVPWMTARSLLAAAVDHVDDLGGVSVRLEADGGSDQVRVVLGPMVDATHELATSPAVLDIALRGCGHGDAGLTIAIACELDPARTEEPRITPMTARSLDRLRAVVDRPTPHQLTVTTAFHNEADSGEEPDIEAALSAPLELLATSPFSGGARRVYRRGSSVIKVQRHDLFDPKPTLLEDEFHLLRRLRGRSDRFPSAIGYGIEGTYSWIAYDHVAGQSLDRWLAGNSDEAPSRLLSFGVDLNEMIDELSACRIAHRDLNPGNLIVDPTGGLVLIDFDQGASGIDYVGADRDGVEAGLAKNDLVEFLERARLTRAANELISALDEAWPTGDVPFSLGVLGLRFGDGWPIEPLLSATRRRLGSLEGLRVLELHRTAPIAGLLLASAGAEVTAVVDEPGRWRRLAALEAPRFEPVTPDVDVSTGFDLALALGEHGPESLGSADVGTVLSQHAGRGSRSTNVDPWLTTVILTQVGSATS